MTDWARALDDLEDRMVRMAAALPSGDVTALLAPFSPPDVGTPLPHELRDRAMDLWQRGQALLNRLAAEQQRIRTELDGPRRSSGAPARPSMLDTRA
jgi:hypothetical protein